MLRVVHRCRRSAAVLGAGLVAGAVLTGCSSDETPTAPAAATGPVETSPAPATATDSDLAAGLLPAEAFGDGAEVDQLPLDHVPDHWHHWGHWGHWGHWWQDDEDDVTPPECLTALEQAATQFSGVQDAAGQVARIDELRTVEVLAVPDAPVDVVEQFKAVVGACDDVSFGGRHDHADMTGQVSIDALPDVPEGMAGVSVTYSGDYPGGSWSATVLAGVAQDGDRMLALVQMSHHGGDLESPDGDSPDPDAFVALLEQAYDVQADALD
jgi:hypothetical protein